MRINLSQRSAVVLAIIFSLVVIGLSEHATAQVACPSGMHAAAANEVPGVPAGTCTPNGQNNPAFGGCGFNPYPIVESFKSGSNVQITPSSNGGSLQDGINPVLACRLAQFLQYAQQSQGCKFTISSGYRSAQTQANTCQSICGNSNGCSTSSGASGDCGAPGGSCHQYGLAVDINGSASCMNWAHSFLGVKNTSSAGAQQYKIFFPISSDLVHVQCIEDSVGACSPSTKPCDGSVSITPNLSYTPSSTQTPSSPITSALRSLFAPQQPTATPTAAPIAQPTVSPSTAPSCSPQYICSGNTLSYQDTTCNVTTVQTCQYGCSGNACATSAASSTYLTVPTINPVSATSAIALLEDIANPMSATTTAVGTATPIALNANSQDIGQIQQANPVAVNAQNGNVVDSSGAEQTFTSSNLDQGEVSNAPASPLMQLLQNLSAVLMNVIAYLQPFGGNVPVHYISE